MSEQRYTSERARQRLRDGLCPECGGRPDQHTGWGRPGCGLTDNGVVARIAQYRADERTREQAIGRVAAELARHAVPRFIDDDHKDTGSLNCQCGVRIPPREGLGIRDWTAYHRHVAEAIVAVTGLAGGRS
jgi:hypothetical protein